MKKYFVFICLCLFQAKIFASDTTRIIGNIAGLKDSVIELAIPILDSSIKYSIKVKDGEFEWKGFVAQPERASLHIAINSIINSARFYIDTGNAVIKIEGNIDSLDGLKVTGSKPQEEYKQYNNSFENEMLQYNELFNDSIYKAAHKDENAKKAWMNKRIEIWHSMGKKKEEFVLSHHSSIVSLSLIEEWSEDGDFAFTDSLYQTLSPYARQTNAGKRIEKILAVLKRSEVGQPFIDFIEKDTSGKSVRLSGFKGKYVLLDFWASWCGPCRAENPNVLKAYNEYKNKNFTVVGVSLDGEASGWKKAIREDGMPWEQVSQLKAWNDDAATAYGIRAIPRNFLIDPNGIIIAKDLRDVALQNKLAEVLGK